MDLHLQNVRTGETFKLSTERTLIGAADHAVIKTAEDGPYLVALVVRYPSGWALFSLSDDPEVTFNRKPLRAVQRVSPKKGDLLVVHGERFTFLAPNNDPAPDSGEPLPPPVCLAYIRNPDGMEECRAVDHDLLFGRLPYCHVQLADSKLSRLSALLACDDGIWYVHTLSKKVIGRNRKAVHKVAMVADGDELLIGPLVVRIELRGGAATMPDSSVSTQPNLPAARPPAQTTETAEATDDGMDGSTVGEGPNLEAIRAVAQELEHWLKALKPPTPTPRSGLGGWLEGQRDRFRRFWYDTPETTSARSLRASGRLAEAFGVLERAIRARPESPELLRELYRLYEAVGLDDLCFRPLRLIEKLADARGAPDTWVLETLARLCEKLGPTRGGMFDRALSYWSKLETATGVSYSRQKANVLALRAIHQRGQTSTSDDD